MKRVISILVCILVVSVFVAPVSAAEKEWTWLVFLNADNNLDSCGVDDQLEMAKVGSNDYLNIVSLIDRENGPATLNYIEKGNVKKVKDMGELDMGDYKFFAKFVKDMILAYPAKHYAVIVWNHGSGWDKKNGPLLKGISYDDSSNNHITTAQLGLAVADIKKALGRNLDILGMDACLMQMMEVAYAVKESCDYIVASEETEPGDGYPYDDILITLKKGSQPADLCKAWVNAYGNSYNNGSQGSSDSTQSALACAKLGAVKDAIDGFAKAAMSKNYAAEFKSALSSVQEFYYSSNKDLLHLNSLLKASIKDADFQAAAANLETALNAAIISNLGVGSTMKNAQGLAIYFPENSYGFSSDYAKLAFAQDGMWDEMLADYYKKSSREIVADVESGDVSSLKDFVATANENNREISNHLISVLNFRVFTEGGMNSSVQDVVKTMVSELKAK